MFYSLSKINQKRQYYYKEKILFLLKCILLYFLFSITSILLIFAVDEFIVHGLGFPSIRALIKKSKSMIIENYNLFSIVILVPLIEELFFRLILKPYKKNIAFFSFMFSFMICYGGQYPNKIDTYLLFSLLISLLFSVLVFYVLNKKTHIEEILWKNQKILVIFFTLIFGLIHISNIDKVGTLHWKLSLFYPIYVLPQMIMGYFCAVLRLKSGLIWGVLFHSIINLIGISV